jgi:hypothetical protein
MALPHFGHKLRYHPGEDPAKPPRDVIVDDTAPLPALPDDLTQRLTSALGEDA